MELKISHGIIEGGGLARERSDQARGSLATERREGGFPPPTVGSFLIFRLENVQSGAYLRRKFQLGDMYYIIITCMELIKNRPWFIFNSIQSDYDIVHVVKSKLPS